MAVFDAQRCPRTRTLGTLLAIPAIVAIAGCGGTSDFRGKVNSICKDFDKQTKSLNTVVAGGNPGEIASAGERLLPVFDRTETRLRGVKATSDVRKKYGTAYTDFVSTFVQEHALFKQFIVAARQGDKQTVQALEPQLGSLSARGKSDATRMGLKACQ